MTPESFMRYVKYIWITDGGILLHFCKILRDIQKKSNEGKLNIDIRDEV